MSANRAWLRALETTAALSSDPAGILPSRLDGLAGQWGDAPALISAAETLSYAQLAERARAYTRWALARSLGPGSVVGLLMPNRPDYLAIWLGVSRTGAVVALLNTHLVSASLAHAVAVVNASHVVVASELHDQLMGALAELRARPEVWVRGDTTRPAQTSLDPAAYSGAQILGGELPSVGMGDRALHIYTSGTTGLPKAANVSHHRLLMWAGWFSGMMQATAQDRLYNCLPMYHSVGGVVATGALLLAGGSVVLAEKFSATRFWSEVVGHECTIFQYIGELCRYLLAAAPEPRDRDHQLRLACGNGLREQVWRDFQARFQIPQVLEFYAATEGVFSLYNAEGKPGAIGRVPAFLAHRFPAAVIRLDGASGAPERGAEGLCIRCAPDEPGEAIGLIGAAEGATNRFEGYTSAEETQKKILRGVFKPGDAWMRTGDLMRIDPQGFYVFVDRLGDTFRWKGENVSTTEVADALAACPQVSAAAVYGVTVPGAEGRAGMAALTVEPGFNIARLARPLAERLPAYARPLFIRLTWDLDATETFKLKKGVLAEEAFDPARVSDPLFVFDTAEGGYRALDPPMFARIQAGEHRF